MSATKNIKLNPFSYVVLILVGETGAGPHDLVRMMEKGRIYWSAAESQYYAEPKRLAEAGYLEAQRGPGQTRERTHYSLTAKGREAVADWLDQPAAFARIQNEPAVRLLGTDLGDEKAVVASLGAIRVDIAQQREQLELAREIAADLPHRRRYLQLNEQLSFRILDAFSDWLDSVERELG
jgi:DNA-binding PadR family transcriptional regulator